MVIEVRHGLGIIYDFSMIVVRRQIGLNSHLIHMSF